MGRLNKTVRLLLVAMLVFSMMITCCGCKETETDADGKDVIVSPMVEPSKEEAKATAEPVTTEEPGITEEPVTTDEPEEVVLSGDYLKELAQEEIWEFKLSDYNADFVAGNLVTITMVLESAGEFNGTLGTCIGTAYTWEQTEFSSEAGEYTVEWKIQPSVDMAQLGLWYAENGSIGVKSVDVVIEEVEVDLEGDYIKVLQMGDNWEMTLSDYNAEYQVGDFVNIEITMESDGDFNGAVGACVGKDYAWQQKEYKYDAAGTYTFSWKVKPSTDMAQIGVWWTGGTGVGVVDVKVTIEEQPIGISGDYIELFTEQGYYEFSPAVVSGFLFQFGDTIKVTVELESDGAFNGCMATCVGSNYAWEQTEMSGEAGTTTWTMTVSPTADLIQIAVWWIDGTAVGIKDIKVEMVKWGYQHKIVSGDIYTSTSTDNDYTFKPSDYCDFNDGDIITIEVGLDSNDIYNGCVRMTDVNGVSRSANFESRGTAIANLVLQANRDTEATIDFWWMNTKVALNTIKVYVGGELPKVEPGVFEYSSTQTFPLTDYVDYKAGDTLKITATLSSDGEFNGALAASTLDAANGYWDQETFESKDGSAVTCTFILEKAQITDLQIMIWWVGGSKVVVDPKAITVEVIESGSDTGSGDAGSGDTGSGDAGSDDDDTTPPEVAGTLIFNGDANESYESTDVTWLMDAADDDVITLVYKGESGKNGWGVLGWGASVDGNWIDSNTVKSLGYNSDSTDGSKELTVTMTAAELKAALGITADSTVSSIKLGAWNGGQIVSLSIAGKDEDSGTEDDGNGDAGTGDAGTGDDETGDDETGDAGTTKTPDLCLADTSYDFDVKTLLPDVKAGDKVLVTAKITTESTGGFKGGIGMHDANTNADGSTWKAVEYTQAGEHTLEVTILEKTGDDGNPYLASQGQVQLWWPDATAGYDVELFVEMSAELVTPSEGDDEDDTDEDTDTDDTPTYPVWGENSVTFLSNTGYWSEQVITLSQLLGEVEASKVESITFSSDVNIAVGYKNTDGSGVVDSNNTDAYWSQVDNATSHTLGNISFGDNFYMKLVLRDSSEEAHTISWTIKEKEEITYPVWGENSVTYVGTSGWTEQAITLEQLLGDVDVAMVEKVTISCETANIGAGYSNNTGENNWWSQVSDAQTHELTDINFSNFNMKLVLQATDSQAHKITWTVQEKTVTSGDSIIYTGSIAAESDWSVNLQLDKSKFANCKFDGTEMVTVTYVAKDAEENVAFKYATVNNYKALFSLDDGNGGTTDCCWVDKTSVTSRFNYVLDSSMSDIKNDGLQIQGYNWVITEVSIREVGEKTPTVVLTNDSKKAEFNISDYIPDVKAGDVVKISVSTDVVPSYEFKWNGAIGGNDVNGWQSVAISNSSDAVLQMTVAEAESDGWTYLTTSFSIELYWISDIGKSVNVYIDSVELVTQ